MINILIDERNTCFICLKEKTKDLICCYCKNKMKKVDEKIYIDNGVYANYIYEYDGILKDIIGEYKFKNKRYFSKVFSKIIIDYINTKNIEFDYILYVPSDKERIKQRGFDHLKLICKYLKKEKNIEIIETLEKIKNTKMQHFLKRKDRAKNLKGAFKLKNKEILKDKKLLIIDDIVTTGETLKEINNILKKSNIKNIKYLCICGPKKRA